MGVDSAFLINVGCGREFKLHKTLRWRHNGHDSISNHQPHNCLLNRLFGCRSNKASKLRVTGLCAGNSTGTGEFPAQMASNTENVSIWWRHRDKMSRDNFCTTRYFSSDLIWVAPFGEKLIKVLVVLWAPSQYKDRLIYVWRFPC